MHHLIVCSVLLIYSIWIYLGGEWGPVESVCISLISPYHSICALNSKVTIVHHMRELWQTYSYKHLSEIIILIITFIKVATYFLKVGVCKVKYLLSTVSVLHTSFFFFLSTTQQLWSQHVISKCCKVARDLVSDETKL